jgi:hypothetical protein
MTNDELLQRRSRAWERARRSRDAAAAARAEQVVAARKLEQDAIRILAETIDRQRIDREAVAHAVRFARRMKDVPRRGVADTDQPFTTPRTKAQKLLARRVATALLRLQHLLTQVERDYPSSLIGALLPTPEQLEAWRKHCTALARVALGNRQAQVWPAQLMAAREAALLLEQHDGALLCKRKTASAKASAFLRLAAVLYGDPKANLFHACRAVKEERRRALDHP